MKKRMLFIADMQYRAEEIKGLEEQRADLVEQMRALAGKAETEKRALAAMVERSFYPSVRHQEAAINPQAASIMEALNGNPELAGQILKNLLLQTAYAQPNATVTG